MKKAGLFLDAKQILGVLWRNVFEGRRHMNKMQKGLLLFSDLWSILKIHTRKKPFFTMEINAIFCKRCLSFVKRSVWWLTVINLPLETRTDTHYKSEKSDGKNQIYVRDPDRQKRHSQKKTFFAQMCFFLSLLQETRVRKRSVIAKTLV